VSIPTWATYKSGLEFVKSKSSWINKKRPLPQAIRNNQTIGRAHRICFKKMSNISKTKSRIINNQIIISHPDSLDYSDKQVQSIATKASIKALRQQAQSLLPQRLDILSKTYLLPYRDIQIKQLTRRWGSCDQNKSIVLNLFLIQLPWELIDYVIIHELTHTKHLNHSLEFWNSLETIKPEARQLKKLLNKYHPSIIST
jgi:hypothetical protein